ncbi:DUF1566 domain-containing protein [Herbaspirillum sp.]|jgi:hypothetical protein|uniref:Lcl C-terminal domain-containing protein n=1 Tax=Herbaspirillum sp. TaxID=1890675 RepID=UPI000C0AF69F|nr:DUF1566 domain-containing protein [Herbaspirillum sp.]MAF06173.1 hypothetical protein [Herbaspirillum sp.]|tara:strand:+ start:29876 stop:30442 length:567 start_codon:yes stop_codon:yes gene_type:complete
MIEAMLMAAGSKGIDWENMPIGTYVESEGGYFSGIMYTEAAGGGQRYALVVSPKAEGSNSGNTAAWDSAISYAAGLNIGGYTDWKLPDLDEMRILYRAFKPTTESNDTSYGATDRVDPPLSNYTSGNPAQTALTGFQEGGSEAFVTSYYWSATESGSSAWRVYIDGGGENLGFKTSNIYVRSVRRVYF